MFKHQTIKYENLTWNQCRIIRERRERRERIIFAIHRIRKNIRKFMYRVNEIMDKII